MGKTKTKKSKMTKVSRPRKNFRNGKGSKKNKTVKRRNFKKHKSLKKMRGGAAYEEDAVGQYNQGWLNRFARARAGYQAMLAAELIKSVPEAVRQIIGEKIENWWYNRGGKEEYNRDMNKHTDTREENTSEPPSKKSRVEATRAEATRAEAKKFMKFVLTQNLRQSNELVKDLKNIEFEHEGQNLSIGDLIESEEMIRDLLLLEIPDNIDTDIDVMLDNMERKNKKFITMKHVMKHLEWTADT
jgi:hypothetical protein